MFARCPPLLTAHFRRAQAGLSRAAFSLASSFSLPPAAASSASASPSPRALRLALVLAYDGSHFIGSASAGTSGETVDGALLAALQRVGAVSGGDGSGRLGWSRASRTDRGVHAAASLVTLTAAPPAALAALTPSRHAPARGS